MGMAASQARFLGLTARKSNVEYQGQQVNQQRTALSNESANLYNQMLELTVPTPPSTQSYYKTTYVIDDTQTSYAKSNYRITNATKTYNKENEYKISVETDVEKQEAMYETYKSATTAYQDEDGQDTSFSFVLSQSVGRTTVTYVVGAKPESKDKEGKDSGKADAIAYNQIYYADPKYKLDGYATCCTEKDAQGIIKPYYFFKDNSGKNHFLTQDQLTAMTTKDDTTGEYPQDLDVVLDYQNVYTTPYSTEVYGILEKASSGRFSSITIYDDKTYPEILKGATKSITTTREYDEQAYNDAYNDYEYEKNKYEQAIQNINAKTEIIQKQDQQLELRLQQLNTEQDALKTEMDSVSKVIDDNVEKTFKVFA